MATTPQDGALRQRDDRPIASGAARTWTTTWRAEISGLLCRWPALVTALLTGLACGLANVTVLGSACSPNSMSMPHPAAGIALAAVLVFGRPALLGVLLGATASQAALLAACGWAGFDVCMAASLTGLGALLQAWAGAVLIRRFVGQPLVLDTARDLLLAGVLGALVACTLGASLASLGLAAAGRLDTQAWWNGWMAWWLGDTMGVVVGAPVALTFIGRPREDWLPRRRTVAIPLIVALGLWAAAMHELQRLDTARLQARFERDADRLAASIQERLAVPLYALKALQSAARVKGTLDDDALRDASHWWLRQPLHLQAMGHTVRLTLAEIPSFEATARAQGLPTFSIHDARGSSVRQTDGEVIVIRRIIELGSGQAQALLGLNVLSLPGGRDPVLAARRTDDAAATAGFRLALPQRDDTGVVLNQALYDGNPATEAERQRDFRGTVFVTVNLTRSLSELALTAENYLRWCLLETDPAASRPQLAGSAGMDACDASTFRPEIAHVDRTLSLGGRQLLLRIATSYQAMPELHSESSWLRPVVGLSGLALLCALLLAVTGMTRRTQRAVEAGTAELRREMGERVLAEQSLKDSEARLRGIWDSVPLGVGFLDTRGFILECNPKMCEMTGRPLQSLRGHPVAEFLSAEDVERVLDRRRALMTGQQLATVPCLHVIQPDGDERQVRVRAAALRDSSGRVQRIVAVVEDIREEMRLLASERALDRAETASRAKSDFLSRMSHDLRTPLNAIIGFAQLLSLDSDSRLAPRQHDWAQQIQHAGWHLLEMIDETSDLAAIETGSVRLTIAPVDIATIVAACRAMVLGAAAQRGISLDERLASDLPAVLADAGRVKQVLTNLLSNAVKYNRENGSVTVAARRTDDAMVEIAVTDTGLGMTPEQLHALFQPYNRLGRESTDIKGTGIGLVISRHLTELMGGRLSVESRRGEGSTFTITLPAES